VSITTDHNFGFATRGFSWSVERVGPIRVATNLGHLGVLDREDLEEALWWRWSCFFGLASDAEAEQDGVAGRGGTILRNRWAHPRSHLTPHPT
jgi:hypothetical protein